MARKEMMDLVAIMEGDKLIDIAMKDETNRALVVITDQLRELLGAGSIEAQPGEDS